MCGSAWLLCRCLGFELGSLAFLASTFTDRAIYLQTTTFWTLKKMCVVCVCKYLCVCTFYAEPENTECLLLLFSSWFLETGLQWIWCSHTWRTGAQKAHGIMHAGVIDMSCCAGKPSQALMFAQQALGVVPRASTRPFLFCFESRVHLLWSLGWLETL